MFKVLFKVAHKEDLERVKEVILANHTHNGDELIFSDTVQPADIVIEVPKVEKLKAVIFDHSGTVHRLGFPCDIEYDELPGDSDGMDESKKQREREKKEKLPKECPKCHRMKEPGEYKCLNCGHKPIGGDDVETDESRGLTLIKGKKRTREDSQSIYSQLIGYRNERQLRTGKLLSDGWVSHTYKEITGVWPRKLSKQPIECSQEIRNIIRAKFQKWAKQQA